MIKICHKILFVVSIILIIKISTLNCHLLLCLVLLCFCCLMIIELGSYARRYYFIKTLLSKYIERIGD